MEIFNIYHGEDVLGLPKGGFYVEGGDHHSMHLLKYNNDELHPDYRTIAETVAANYPGEFSNLTLLSEKPMRSATNHRFGVIKGRHFKPLKPEELFDLAKEIASALRGKKTAAQSKNTSES